MDGAAAAPPQHHHHCNRKVTVVGAGQVGIACVVSILQQRLCDEMALVDVVEDKVKGEVMDLQHGAMWMNNATVTGSSDYSNSDNSSVVVITAGVRQKSGESRLNLVQRNVSIFKHIIPEVVKRSPDAIIIVVSNPCDVMAWVAWKLSGLPNGRVFGSGTTLDTCRLRHFLGHRLGVGASSIHGYVIGEHGDSSVSVFSTCTVAGAPILDVSKRISGIELTDEERTSIHKQVVEAAGDIINLKGYTNWGIGIAVAGLIETLFANRKEVYPVSTLVTGLHGIETETFASVPCLLGNRGVSATVPMALSDDELKAFQASVGCVHGITKDVKLD